MKKLLLLPALVFFAVSMQAQNSHFGLSFSPGIYWFSPDADSVSSDGVSFGYSYGAITDFGFTPNYSFSTGFSVMNISSKYVSESPTGKGNVNAKINFMYINIPLTIKMRTNEIGYIRYFGQVGLNAGVRIRADITGSTVTSGGSEPFSKKITADAAIIRPSLNIGAGLEYYLSGSTALMAGLHYDNGFTSVTSTKKGYPFLFSRGIRLDLGILF
jgi:hypothetical protein